MKAKNLHPFHQFASKFTLKSILRAVSKWSFELIKNPDKDLRMFATHKAYEFILDGRKCKGVVSLYQTNLIDVIYDLICFNNYGKEEISDVEALYLIHLHVNFEGSRIKENEANIDFWLRLMANLGEQKKFQQTSDFSDDFSREKYILETISKKTHVKNTYKLDFEQEFFNETSMPTTEYSAIVFALFVYFSHVNIVLNPSHLVVENSSSLFTGEKIINMAQRYSTTIEEIKESPMKRQIFYQKPLIKIDNDFICVNPFLMLSTFVNSNFWIVRNIYNAKKSQNFTNAFGKYFEIYFEEILENCLSSAQYENIEETSKEKCADWHIKIGEYNFIVEQKSAISFLSIKQCNADIDAMKKYILTNWGKAVKQLEKTQETLKIEKPIKIILIYEDFFNCICLDKLFELDKTLFNDKYYWLMSIKDFEKLMYTYKTNPEIFFKVVSEKIKAEETHSNEGRDISKFLSDNGITENDYLSNFGISEEFEKIEDYLKQNLS